MDASVGSYPELPSEPDCVYYLRTGLCGYGMKCHLNHPPNIKQYYMKIGTCKFGATCKYHHPHDRVGLGQQAQLNLIGLPMRLGEKDCVYYMRTGSCKYGLTCKFHHPQPTTVGTFMPISASSVYSMAAYPSAPLSTTPYPQGLVSWPSTKSPCVVGPNMQSPSAYLPVIFSLPQAWSAYQVARIGFGDEHLLCMLHLKWIASMYQGPVGALTPLQGLQKFPGTGLVYRLMQPNDQVTSAVQGINPPLIQGSSATMATPEAKCHVTFGLKEAFPERPGQPECQYYLKTGDCKFGASCKYRHPKESAVQLPTCVLSPIGLPIRSKKGQPTCTFYSQNGICKFGPMCKFDHPMIGLIYSLSVSSLSELPVAQSPKSTSSKTTLDCSTPENCSKVSITKDQPSSTRELTSSQWHSSTLDLGNMAPPVASVGSGSAGSS